MPHAATEFLTTIWRALGGDAKPDARVEFTGEGALPSVFAVTDLAAASIGAAALAVVEYADAGAAMTPAVSVDRRLASFWLASARGGPTECGRRPVACADPTRPGGTQSRTHR
jgi:hypothetical protein